MKIRENGFTLTELIVTLFVMSAIMAATFSAFLTLSKSFKNMSKRTETHMEDIAGLDIMKYDIEMAGYGLPRAYYPPALGINYTEAASTGTYGLDPVTLNDAPANEPRAYVFADNVVPAGGTGTNTSDVLAIKSFAVALTSVSEKWTFVYYNGTNWVYRLWNDTRYDFKNHEIVVFVSAINKVLQVSGGNWYFTLAGWPTYNTATMPVPGTIDLTFIMYGITTTTATTAPRMPFNRVDYFLYRPAAGFPARCNPNTYTLYRATINQSTGARDIQPILDCVADFQVGFGLDTDANNIVDTWTSNAVPTSASTLQDQLKELKVFLLIQEGQYDPDFTFATNSTHTLTIGDSDITLKTFDLTTLPNYAHYRWKVYKMVTKPLNLM
ncbi:MAG: PilW family protein [Nitrospirae bacterium]|nr:PilW family protein [Nitrospirota bacterium]